MPGGGGHFDDSDGTPISLGDAQRKPLQARPKTRPSYNTRTRKFKRHAHKGKAHGMRAGKMNRIKGS